MNKLLTLGMAAVLLTGACVVRAYPTLLGPTGLINAPTGYVTGCGELDLAADYDTGKGSQSFSRLFLIATQIPDDFTRLPEQTTDKGTASVNGKSSWPLRASYGVARSFEVGLAYDVDGWYGSSFWDVNAKYQLPYNWCNSAFAIGALYGESGSRAINFFDADGNLLDSENHRLDATEIYLAGTHNFCLGTMPLGVTLGVNWAEVNFVDHHDGLRGQLGLDAAVWKKIDLVADVQTKEKGADVKDLWSAGVRYYSFIPGLSAEVGVTNGPFIGTAKSGWLIGLNYAIPIYGNATGTTAGR